MKKLIRVCVVDDHPGVRAAIKKLFEKAEDITVVGEGVNGVEALQITKQERPDILLLDVEMPVLRGDEVLQIVKETVPDVKVLALSSYNDPIFILGMLENGAAGYITKEEANRTLLMAVRSIIDDEVKYISPAVASKIPYIILDEKTLTGQELEILRYICLGKSDGEIAGILHIDEVLLNNKYSALFEKFEVSSRGGLKEAAQGVVSTTQGLNQKRID